MCAVYNRSSNTKTLPLRDVKLYGHSHSGVTAAAIYLNKLTAMLGLKIAAVTVPNIPYKHWNDQAAQWVLDDAARTNHIPLIVCRSLKSARYFLMNVLHESQVVVNNTTSSSLELLVEYFLYNFFLNK